MADDNRLNGYVKDYRSCLDNALFNEKPFDRWHAFQYCILKANHKPCEVIYGNQVIRIERGQFLTSASNLATTFGWTTKQVRGWLKLMEKLNMLTSIGHAKGTTITVVNYTFYQGDGNTEGHTEGKHRESTGKAQGELGATNKNDKNDKNDKNVKKDIYIGVPDELKTAFMEFAEMRKAIKKPITTVNTVTRILNRLNQFGHSTEEKIAILNQSTDNCWQDVYKLKDKPKKGTGNPYLDMLGDEI